VATPLGIAAANLEDAYAQAVVRPIVETSPILQHIFVVNTGGDLTYGYNQDYQLPTASFIGLNQAAPAPTSGAQRRVMATAARMVVKLRIDNTFKMTPGKWESEERKQVRLGGVAAGLKFSEEFFDGNPLTNPLEPTGLYRYLASGLAVGTIPSQQQVSMTTGGDTLTLQKLNVLLSRVKGSNKVLFMNETMHLKILELCQTASAPGYIRIQQTENDFGKPVDVYGGVPIRVIEREDNYATVLDFDENDGSGNLDTCSIWCVSFGNETGVYAFAPRGLGMNVSGFKEIPGETYSDSLTEWYFQFVVSGPRSIARLRYVNNA
jgi:hypothetical protein